MIEVVEVSGQLKLGGIIVEFMFGNIGVGLVLVVQCCGYKCVFVCLDKVSEDKCNVLIVYGVEVVVCLMVVLLYDLVSYYSVLDWLVCDIDGVWKFDQYVNLEGLVSYYVIIGLEIWVDIEGKVIYFVVGIGIGGIIIGVGWYFKEVFGG